MSTSTAKAEPIRRGRRPIQLALMLVLPSVLLGACSITDVITKPIEIISDVFGLGSNEVATPEFTVTNGIKVQVVIKAPKDQAGVPITVHVRCAGGTTAAATVTLHDSGDISIGDVTFNQGWPVGADCVVSQEIVQGVDIAQKTLTWLSSNNVQANFLNI